MTTPAVPIVHNITDLRKRFGPGVHFLVFHMRNRHKGAEMPRLTIYQAFCRGRPGVFSPHTRYAAEAAQALAERLVAAGYEPKGERC